MELARQAKLSLVYFIKDLLHSKSMNTVSSLTFAGLYVNVIEGWPADFSILTPPMIVVERYDMYERTAQVGGGYITSIPFYIDIYALRGGQKDDLAQIVFDGLNLVKNLYNYSSGFPTYAVVGDKVTRTSLEQPILHTMEIEDVRSKYSRPIPPATVGNVLTNRERIDVTFEIS